MSSMLEGLPQLGGRDRLDPILEEERGRRRAQLRDAVAGLERSEVVVLHQDPAVVLVQRLMDLDHVAGLAADDAGGLHTVEDLGTLQTLDRQAQPLGHEERDHGEQEEPDPEEVDRVIDRQFEIGRAHGWTPVTWPSRMPASAW